MILKRLFEAFFRNNIICVVTSNRPPEDLYLNGLQRFLFLPFIDMVKERMELVNLDGIDYRVRETTIYDTYFYPNDDENQKRLEILWDMMTDNHPGDMYTVKVAQGRTLDLDKYHDGVAMVNFEDLCGKALGNSDYMALCRSIHTLVLTDVPTLSLERRDFLRRFIWLVDELYNHKIRLYMKSETKIKELYQNQGEDSYHDENFAFDRTISRLVEMQTKKYINSSKAKDYVIDV